MAKVYGRIGSLSQLLYELENGGVNFLNSLEEVISFRRDFEKRILLVKEKAKADVLSEKEVLEQKIAESSNEYDARVKEQESILTKEKEQIDPLIASFAGSLNLVHIYKRYRLQIRKNKLVTSFEEEKRRPYKKLEKDLSTLKQNLAYLEVNIDKVIEDRANSESRSFCTAKSIIEQNEYCLLGAIGEQKALSELNKLPDSYRVINDFQYEFRRALHNRNSEEWIKSVQADHIVIGPTGVFIIETKNWGSSSIRDLDLYSPVEQIKRTSYALFFLLNKSVVLGSLPSFSHHWGSRKISVNSIILMVNKSPSQQFQYVKILSLYDLCQYITHSRQALADNEVQEISDYLLQI